MAATEEKVRVTADGDEPVEPDEETTEPTEPETGEDDGNEEGDEETVAEPEQKAPAAGDPRKALDRAFKAFADKLMRIFEVDELEPVSIPGILGFMMPGFAEPRTHENFIRCSTCNGLGKVITQAQTGEPSKDWHVCPDTRCKGNGFWQKSQPQTPPVTTGPLAVNTQTGEVSEFAEAPTWMGDPTLTPGQ